MLGNKIMLSSALQECLTTFFVVKCFAGVLCNIAAGVEVVCGGCFGIRPGQFDVLLLSSVLSGVLHPPFTIRPSCQTEL